MPVIVTVKVAITQANDEVAIMSFVTIGRGDVLPVGAEWVDKAAGQWMREPKPETLEHEISRTAGLARPIKGYRLMGELEGEQYEKGLADRTYRNAWRDRSGRIEVDMPAAREIHRERMRIARAAKLQELDGEWMRATGQGKKEEAEAVEAKRQTLRDALADPAIEAAETPEALRAIWPQELQEG